MKPATNLKRWDLLLPQLPVLFFFVHNFSRFSEILLCREVVFLFLFYLAFGNILFLVVIFLFRQTAKQAAFFCSIFLVSLLFFGVIRDKLVGIPGLQLFERTVPLFLLFAFLIFFPFLYWRKAPILPKLNRYLLTVFTVLILLDAGKIAIQYFTGRNAISRVNKMTVPQLPVLATGEHRLPDIYNITFDSYSNDATLKKNWGYENELGGFLRSAGFFYADSAISAYDFTPYSLGAMFNLQYLKNADEYLAANSPNFYTGQLLYRRNELFRFLKAQGYELSVFSMLENRDASRLGVSKPSKWLRLETIERLWLYKRGDPEMAEDREDYMRYNQEALSQVLTNCQASGAKKPLFSFTHFLLPHEPYVYDENGKAGNGLNIPNEDTAAYLAQLKYANKLIRQITHCLLADSSREKIIIFHGDHGFRYYINKPEEERFGAMLAVFSGKKDLTLRNNENLVNLYRKILNSYFGAGLPVLENRIVKPIHP